MNPRKMRCGLLLAAGLLLFIALQIQAATVYVGWDSDGGFSPASVQVNPGDTVVWVSNDPFYSTAVSSDAAFGEPGYFIIYLIDEGDAYGVEFNSLGAFGYHDSWGNSGAVTVVAPVATEISLTTPVIAGNQFLFEANGLTPDKTNVLEVSTNLTSWTAVATNVAASSSASFSRPVVSSSQFFRVVQLP